MSDEPKNLFSEPTMTTQRKKRKKAKSAQVFKPYVQDQNILLPPSLEELIPEKHLVRVVNTTIEGLKLDTLLATYKGGGASAYYPKMLLKVLIYAYLSKIYSSRQIAKALRQDIHFMWLAGMQQPEFSIINHFRSSRLKHVIDEVFGSMVFFLIDKKYIDLHEYFVDGTKLRADNNKHKVVWAKNTKRYKEMVQKKIREHLQEIERMNTQENQSYGKNDLAEMGEQTTLTSNSVKEQIEHLNETLQSSQAPKQVAKAVNNIEKKLLPKLEKYEQQECILAGRNSYGKTDPDATVFRMKDDQLLAGYNILLGTQHQFIVNYNLHQQKASESDALPAHLERLHHLIGQVPEEMMGDSAFGSQENYSILARHNIGNYLKYNTFHREKTKKYRNDPYRKEHFAYDATSDTYTCPQTRTLVFKEQKTITTANGYQTLVRVYQSADCSNCPVAELCKSGEGNRTIQINRMLEAYRAQARQNLDSKRGRDLRKRRGVDVEPVFGDIKFNQGYIRCRLRGKEKVNVEIALLSIAHNTKKVAYWAN
jgi:transposase